MPKTTLAAEVLKEKREVHMICPGCGKENEIAYSALSNGLVCLEPGCSFEIEMSVLEARQVLEPVGELICA